MLDKDKLFIVVYVNITGWGDVTVVELLNRIAEITKFDDSVMRIIIPVRESETRVECINPVLLAEEQYEETRKKIEEITERVDEAIKLLRENKG